MMAFKPIPISTNSSAACAQDGFTLVEMLVVIAIIALAAVVGWQRLPATGERARLDQATALLRKVVVEARTAAMMSGRSARLLIDPDRGHLVVDRGGQAVVTLPQIAMRLTTAIEAEPAGADRPSILFMPDGSNSGAQFDLQAGSSSRRLLLSWLTGRVVEDTPFR